MFLLPHMTPSHCLHLLAKIDLQSRLAPPALLPTSFRRDPRSAAEVNAEGTHNGGSREANGLHDYVQLIHHALHNLLVHYRAVRVQGRGRPELCKVLGCLLLGGKDQLRPTLLHSPFFKSCNSQTRFSPDYLRCSFLSTSCMLHTSAQRFACKPLLSLEMYGH